VGLDLRQVRSGSGGIRVHLRGALSTLVRAAADDTFHVFQSEGDPPLVDGAGRRVAVEAIATDPPCSVVDERALALGLDVLFRGFPTGFHGFPPERQIVFIPDLVHEFFPGFFEAEVLRDRRRRFEAALRHAGGIATGTAFSRGTILDHSETRCGDVFLLPVGPPWDERPGRGSSPARLTPRGRPYFLFPANLWPHKNHRRILQAFRRFVTATGPGRPAPTAPRCRSPRCRSRRSTATGRSGCTRSNGTGGAPSAGAAGGGSLAGPPTGALRRHARDRAASTARAP
jgi:hypothetical protein